MELRMSREVAENARDQHNLLSFSETAAEISSFFLLSYPPCVVETAKEEAEDKEKGEEEGGVWVIEVVPDFGAEEYEVAVHETKIHVKVPFRELSLLLSRAVRGTKLRYCCAMCGTEILYVA
eukprot:2198090-Rhodomonas_salina.2